MNAPTSSPSPRAPKPGEKRGKRPGFGKLRLDGADGEARRSAAVVLEVLAGARTPLEAAQALGISPPRYYLVEQRAVLGLVEALRPRPRGPGRRPEKEVEKLRREMGRLERECARSQALLRTAQRAMGLSPPERGKPPEAGKRKPRRSRLARALHAAEALRSGAGGNPLGEGEGAGEDGRAMGSKGSMAGGPPRSGPEPGRLED